MSTHDREQATLVPEPEPGGRWTRRARKVLSPANVMSATALFVALGGTAYATGIVVPRDSVGDAQIRYQAVRGKHIASDAITTSKVRNGSLRAEDFGKGELPSGAQGPAGSIGPAGPTGLMGLAGPAGADGAQGPAGPMGLTGLQGPVGPVGPQGLMGLPGAAGEIGPQGPVGPAGATGDKGDTGDAGPAGAAGAKGDTGDAGPAGPAGAKGDTGDTGPAGPAGPKGDTGETGPAGTGVTGASASANNSGGTILVILGGTTVPYPQHQNIGTGITVNGASDTFTLASAGRYRISYGFKLSASLPVQSRVLLNGAAVGALLESPATSQSRLSGDAIITVTGGSTIQVQLFGVVGTAVLEPGAGASLVIQRVS